MDIGAIFVQGQGGDSLDSGEAPLLLMTRFVTVNTSEAVSSAIVGDCVDLAKGARGLLMTRFVTASASEAVSSAIVGDRHAAQRQGGSR